MPNTKPDNQSSSFLLKPHNQKGDEENNNTPFEMTVKVQQKANKILQSHSFGSTLG